MPLRERFLDVATRRRLAGSTVECYWSWIAQFLRFCRSGDRWRHPRELAAPEVEAFLTYLARQRQLSASSQNQAVNALVFLYRHVLAGEVAADHLGRFDVHTATRSSAATSIPVAPAQ